MFWYKKNLKWYIIINVSIPLKSQIIQLLQINHIEYKDDIDLITCIIREKNKNRNLIKNENIINNVNKSTLNINIINNIENKEKI